MCSDNVKVNIFRSYCSSLYTSQLWWKYKVSSIRKLYVAYNNFVCFSGYPVIVVQAACLLYIMLRVALPLSGKLYLFFTRELTPLKIVLFEISVDLTSGVSI